MFPKYMTGSMLQGGGGVQGGTPQTVQGSSTNPQRTLSIGTVQPANVNPQGGGAPVLAAQANRGITDPSVDTGAQAAAVAAAREAAAKAARVGALRGEVTNIANAIKDIFNQRYGLVDQSAVEQTGKLNDRFATESGDIATQVEGENQKLGAAHAAGGSYDSSYRGNNVDTVSKAGEAQVRDLGTELQDNIAKIASWVATQKGEFDASKSGIDSIVNRLGESTDEGELTSLRNSIDARLAEVRGQQASFNPNGANAKALESIAPSSGRAQQLKTTLSQIVAGSADPSQKVAIGQRLIQSAGLTPEDAQALLTSFQGDLQKKQQTA